MLVSQEQGVNFLPSGTKLGKYEIVRGVAVGGMAELYLARTAAVEAFNRLVALKRILPQYASDAEFIRMFLDEARLTARLQHPNIAQVYDIGVERDGVFFTMEFVHGEDAQTILRTADMQRTRVPLEQALAIAIGVASGLHAAHEQRGVDGERLGIVHRDVSPSNIIVSFDGSVKLIDFGVAKARGRHTRTRDGVIKGKVSYMSPEQCRGEALDRRSDVFSLGILLYELTTTRRLFIGDNEFAVLKRIVYKDAPRPSMIVPDYPPELEAIVMRALSRNIGRRYQSAKELANALVAFAHSHSLDISAKALGTYMRQMFPDSFRAAEAMNQQHAQSASQRRGSLENRIWTREGSAQASVVADAKSPKAPRTEPLTPDMADFEALLPEPLTPEARLAAASPDGHGRDDDAEPEEHERKRAARTSSPALQVAESSTPRVSSSRWRRRGYGIAIGAIAVLAAWLFGRTMNHDEAGPVQTSAHQALAEPVAASRASLAGSITKQTDKAEKNDPERTASSSGASAASRAAGQAATAQKPETNSDSSTLQGTSASSNDSEKRPRADESSMAKKRSRHRARKRRSEERVRSVERQDAHKAKESTKDEPWDPDAPLPP